MPTAFGGRRTSDNIGPFYDICLKVGSSDPRRPWRGFVYLYAELLGSIAVMLTILIPSSIT